MPDVRAAGAAAACAQLGAPWSLSIVVYSVYTRTRRAHGAVFSRAGGPPETGRGSAAGPGRAHRPDAPGAQSSKRV